MGDHRAGSTGTTATSSTASSTGSGVAGKRAARHAVEPRTSQPYAGRRVARPEPAGRRIAPPPPVTADDLEDVAAHFLAPSTAPVCAPYVGRRVAPSLTAPSLITPTTPTTPIELAAPAEAVQQPVAELPVPEPRAAVPTRAPWFELVDISAQPLESGLADDQPEPVETLTPVPLEPPARTPVTLLRQTRPGARRAASRRGRVPSVPLMAGVAVLAISAGGALQAMHPAAADTNADGSMSPASALSGSGALSASLVGSRSVPVSRDSDRQVLSLQAAANAQAKERDQFLSSLRGKAQAQSAKIRLHRWVLPVTPGVYHLTARFGDYSSLWANFHTGLDFAAPTGTPIMAVAGGTITEVGYSGAYGNRTIEKLPDGTELWYCHQNEFGTQVGATVQPGQVIGYVGSTGNVTGPHLHLEVHPHGGDPVDPYPVLVAHGLYPGPPA
jgi:murein DD-endopeptidase MepM/ murein hydrolase activator NlpD